MSESIFLAPIDGIVVDNKDPLVLGRVRVRIPGLIEPASNWAEPIGAGGSAQRGSYDVPEIGATVTVQFMMGDPERPKYQAGYWGKPDGQSEAPSYVRGLSNGDAPQVKAYETRHFEIVIDDRSGHEVAIIRAKAGERTEFRIAQDGTVTVTAKKILLGGPDADQPFVLGGKWQEMMNTLLTALGTHIHLTSVGPTDLPLALKITTDQLSSTLSSNLSKISFGK